MSSVDAAYILSAGRSGSTLLNLLLGSHPAAIAVGELTHLPKNVALDTPCACGERVRACPFWRDVLARHGRKLGVDLAADPYALDLGFVGATRVVDHAAQTRGYKATWKLRHGLAHARLAYGVPLPSLATRRFDRGIDETLRLYATIREASGAQVVVDASKTYLKGIALYGRAAGRMRLIVLTRDGRASFYSRLRDGFDRRRALDAWLHYYERALPLVERQVPSAHVTWVRYEDLATDPAATCARVCAGLELDYSPQMLDFSRRPSHVANGNDMRLQSDKPIRLDTRWQTELSDADRRYFEAAAGALNSRLGYA
jgi:hypothetical protein